MIDDKKPVFTPEWKLSAIYFELYRAKSKPDAWRNQWRAKLEAMLHDYDDQLENPAQVHARLQAVTDKLLSEKSN